VTQVAYLRATGHNCKTLLGTLTQRELLVWLGFRRDFQPTRIKRRNSWITIIHWQRSIVAPHPFAYSAWGDPDPFVLACSSRAKEVLCID
jgi:hypothetical protein